MITPCIAKRFLLAALVATVALGGCASDPKEDAAEDRYEVKTPDSEEGYVEFVGKVVYVAFEGGFYGLQHGDKKYDPLQLPKEFRQDGMKVRVRARLRDWVSGRNWGRMVHVLAIEPCCEEPEED